MSASELLELMSDPQYLALTVGEFIKVAKDNGFIQMQREVDHIDEMIQRLPKDDSPIGSNPFMEG